MKRFLLAALLLASCDAATVRGALGIQPAAAATVPSGLIQYMAVGAAAPVTWTVVESGGGTVDASGLYHAPACPTVGTFHVQAASGTLTAQAVATVADAPASITVSPPTATLAPGATQQFTATVTTGCGNVSSQAINITRVPAAKGK